MSTEPNNETIERDGRRVAYLDWGGPDVDLLVLLHANGLCAGVFDPIAGRLASGRRVVGVDLCGHGGSDDPVSDADLGYDSMAADVLAVIGEVGAERVAIAGVSLGGGVGIEVARHSEGLVDRLVLMEAIAFASMRVAPDNDANHMAAGARRRRRRFTDRTEARSRFEGRGPFAELHPSCLDGYLRWGLVDTDDGVELACDPETEAALFTQGPHRSGGGHAFDHLSDVTARTHVLAGSDTYLERDWFAQQATAVGVDLELIAGGHFFVFTDIDRGADLIESRII